MFNFVTFVVVLCAVSIYGLTNNLMDLLYLDRIECKFNNDLCRPTKCSTKFHNRTAKLSTISCFAVVPFETVKAKTTLYYRFTGGYRQFAININSDWCSYKNGSQKSVLLELYSKFIAGHSNFDTKCPLTGNLGIFDLPITAQIFGGQFLPVGDYYYEATIFFNGVWGIIWKAYFNIPAGQTILDDAMGK